MTEPIAIAPLRLSIAQACHALNLSRATLYLRIASGQIRAYKDGARTFVNHDELRRYVDACSNGHASQEGAA